MERNKDFLISKIKKIFDKDNNEIFFNKLELKNEKRAHSISYSNVLYIDNRPCNCSEMKSYKVQYLCRCNRYITILLYKYLMKNKLNCIHCMQDRKFIDTIYTKPYELQKGIRIKKKKINKEFNDYDEKFKLKYYKNHLLEDEFYNYLPYIYSINNIILNPKIIKNIKYKYIASCNNQHKFTSKISFDNGIIYNSIKQIALQCSICKKIFNIHLINLRNKNIDDISCKYCNFETNNYKIKLYKDTSITYQSNLEKYFLDKCFENNIQVLNGFEIPYYFQNKLRTYISDFYLPKFKIIIEIKGSNPYYFNDLKSGKLEAKNNAAINFANNNKMSFKFILDDIDNFFENLLNK